METSMRLAALLLFTSIFAPMATAQRKYSEWKTDTCFQGLHWRVSKGDYNASAKKYTAYIQFRNSYQTRVAFGYIVKSSAEELDAYAKLNGVEGRVSSLDSQSEDADLNTKLLTSDTAMLVFGNVRFLAPGDVDVTTKFERCDAPASRGAADYICARKNTFSCPNYQASAAATPAVPTGSKRAPASASADIATIKAKILANIETGTTDLTIGPARFSFRFAQGQPDLVIEMTVVLTNNGKPDQVTKCTFRGEYTDLSPSLKVLPTGVALELSGQHRCATRNPFFRIPYNPGPGNRNFAELEGLINQLAGQ